MLGESVCGVVAYHPPRKTVVEDRDPMRLGERLMKSAVFLCVDRDVHGSIQRVPIATAFIVDRVDPDDRSIHWMYLVTARHIIDCAKDDIWSE